MSSRLKQEYLSHFKATLALSWPIFVGQLGQVLMGVIDTAMVGQVGKVEVAAAGLANSVFFLFAVFGFGLSSAVSPLVSMARARRDRAETAGILRGAYRAGFMLSLVVQLLVIILSYRLNWFGQDTQVAGLAGNYLRIISFSVLPMLLFLCAKQFSDGLSYTWPAMIITLIAVGANALLNWVFIFGNWGVPGWGLDGAGYATVLTRILMMSAMMLFIVRSRRLQTFVRQKPREVAGFTRKVLKIGVPSGLQFFFEVATFVCAMFMAGMIGVDEQAAHQIAISTASLTYMGVTGISAAAGIRVGAAVGLKSTRDIRIAGKAAVLMGIGWMLICGIFFVLSRHQIAEAFIDNKNVQEISAALLLIAALFQISDGVQAIGLGILRGMSDARRPMLITLFAYWVVGLPVAWLLGFQTPLGINGIWYGLLVGLSVSAILLYLRFERLSSLYASKD